MINKKEKEGIAYVLICVLVHGALPILGKYGVSLIHPLYFAALTNLIAAVSLVLLMILKGQSLLLLMDKKQIGYFIVIALFGTTLSNIFLFYGVRLTSGINSAILLQVEPIYAILIGYIILQERVSFRQVLSTFMVMLGTLLVIYQGHFSLNYGDLLVLCTPLCFQTGHLLSKKLLTNHQVNPIIIATSRTLYGGIFLGLLSQLFDIPQMSRLSQPHILSLIIFYGVIVYALSYLTFYESIKRINLSKATAIISIYPAVSIFLAWFILKEKPGLYQLIGFGFILVGIFYLSHIPSQYREKQS